MSDLSLNGDRTRPVDIPVRSSTVAGTLHLSDVTAPQPAVIVVGEAAGGGNGEWRDWVPPLVERGSAVLTFDPSASAPARDDWESQTLAARAEATLAAVEAIRSQPEIDPDRIGLLGVSQGGWVAALAAAESADTGEVAAVVTVSGSGVSVAEQERYRINRQLPEEGFSVMETQLARSLLDRRIARLAGGHPPAAVFADERAYASDRWFRSLAAHSPEELAFLAQVYAFDPAPVLGRVACPVLGVFGGDDSTVPVFESVKRYLASLKGGEPQSQVVIVPGADHELRVTREGVSERPAIVLETIADWLGRALAADRPC